ncbi:MAG TPA: hypothetical protein VFU80_00975, partial [Sphingomicrobium sp.]|nr:hypothetical protein [Sphingomicrobium sp.]
MLSLAALVLAAASTSPTPMLTSASPWWEKVTYTISGDGAQQSCQYESSVGVAGDGVCDDEPSGAIQSAASGGATGAYTKITIERRFTPGAQP